VPSRPASDAGEIPLLVLGLGNVLCGDDGLGGEAIRRLAAGPPLAPGVRLEDGGVLGLALLPTLEAARRAIIVDAVRCDRPPGELVVVSGDDVVPALRERLSPHEIGVWDLLWAARLRGRAPERLAIVGLVPACLDLGVGLSPAVEAGIPALVEAVAGTARAWGCVDV
jgi:hydrogenase maturation protease